MASRLATAGGGLCLALSLTILLFRLAQPEQTTPLHMRSPIPPMVVLGCFVLLSSCLLARLHGRLPAVIWMPVGAGALLAFGAAHQTMGMVASVEIIRPGTVLFLALMIAALIPPTGNGRSIETVALSLATVALLMSLTVTLSYAIGASIADIAPSILIMTPPAAIMGVILATSVIIWRHADGWPGMFAAHARESLIGNWHLPSLVLAIAALQIAILGVARILGLTSGVVDAIVIVLNLAVSTMLMGFAAARLGQRRAERDELISAVELAPVMVVDRNGIIRYWSRGCAELYGWSAFEAVGRVREELLATNAMDCSEAAGDGRIEVARIERHRDGRILAVLDHAKIVDTARHRGSTVNAVTDVTDRRAAEAALRVQETRLRTILDVHGLAAIEWDFDARAITWSVNLDPRMTERASGDIAFHDLWAAIGAEPAECVALGEAIARAKDAPERHFQHYLTVFSGGDLQTFRFSGRIQVDGGRASRMIVACDDVTEERLREQAIQLTEARLATAVAVQGLFIYEYDVHERRTRWSTGNEALFGRGDNDVNASVTREIQAAVQAGHSRLHFTYPFRRNDGAERHAESWARIIYDERDKPMRVVGTHLDVTERVAREQALRAAEAEMRAILATVPDAMVVCSDDGLIRSSSAATDMLFGSPAGGLIGSNVLTIVGASLGIASGDNLAELLDGDRIPEWPLRASFVRPDDVEVPISVVVSETRIDGQRLFVINVRDMRPAIEAEARMVRLRSELDQVSRAGMMGEMAAALAHEINQPLAAIVNFLGAAEIMLSGAEGHEAARGAVRNASEQATRAGEIIRRLRAFITRGEIDMRPEPVAPLVHEAAALAMVNRGSLDVRIRYEFEDEKRLVLGDRIQIQQVLVNLIRNGVDAMAADGGARRELLVCTAMEGDMLAVSVKDEGPGIAPEIYERLFRPFVSNKGEGLGFGLSISRRIVEAHGGILSVAPGKRGGTTFTFTLAIAEEGGPPA